MIIIQPARRAAWLTVAYASLGLGTAGVVVPLLPTTPFLLLAVYAAGRSSPRLRWRLYRHPRYGPSLRAWHRQRAIPRQAKITALALIALSWITLWLGGASLVLLTVLAAFFAVLITFILTRPTPESAAC